MKLHAGFPFDVFAALSRSGQALAPPVKAGGITTPRYVVRNDSASTALHEHDREGHGFSRAELD